MPKIGIERGSRPRHSSVQRRALLFVAGTLAITCFSTTPKAEELPQGQAFVINEDPANPMGERHPGTVAWRTDRIKVAGQKDELVIHGDVEIPDMNLTMAVDIRHNADSSLPASHVVEMKFALRQDVAGGKVISVPGIMMKFREKARGTPLSAVSVKVTEGSFLLGLSDRQGARGSNLQMLKERAWFDIPMFYANRSRGILAVEKGCHGEDVFHEVMVAWEQSRDTPADTGRVSACATASLIDHVVSRGEQRPR
jgi:hypothetical protein